MHTNYDVLGMADLAGDILGFKDREVLDVTAQGEQEEGIGRVGTLPETMSLREAAEYVRNRLKLDTVKVFGDMDSKVSRAALCPGSGKSEVDAAIAKGAQVLIAGDIDHHTGLDAVEQGLAIIDAGHYGTEYIFMDDMEAFLEKHLPDVKVTKEAVKHPFLTL
jgi:putative NIF3 family GTP cyclohydrolase 1 type 2